MTIEQPAHAITIRFCRLPSSDLDVPLPCYMSAHASGMDVAAANAEPIVLQPGTRALIPTGFTMEIPPGYEAQIRPRSGLAIKQGIMVLNTPGTIDADYRGEVKIILANLGDEPVTVLRGDRIAQMVIAPVIQAQIREVAQPEELTASSRDTGGFGSTGK